MNITLYGSASDRIDRAYIEGVEALGRAIAKRGHTMVFGAGSTGLMGAASRGMHEAGGNIIGVTPHFMHSLEPISTLCTELIATETMAERKTIMEDKADAFIITPGGLGTLDEFFQILTLKILGRHDKPIVLYNINGYWDSLLGVIGAYILKSFISPEVANDFCICETPESVFKAIEKPRATQV
ncbi:MAG: TIGR00730 family Rossman fold protein [Clostridia bacterium]|nr:TIGR00730 family Rossman fold protein [Clostridia bacterium]